MTGEDDLDELRDFYDGNAIYDILRTYGRAEAPQFLLGTTASIISRAQELVPAFILGLAIDAIFMQTRRYALPGVPQAWIPADTLGQLWLSMGILTAAYGIGAGMRWVNSWAWNHFSQHLQHAIRTDAYDRMQNLDLTFFDNRQTGEIMSVLNNDVNRLEGFLTDRLNSAIRIVVRVGGMGLVMLLLNWQLALIPVVTIPLLGAASYVFVRRIHPKYQAVRSAVGKLNSRLENNIGGIEVVKAYNKDDFESDRVESSSREYLDKQWDAITTRIKFFPTLRIITAAGFISTFVVGGIWVVYGPPAPFTTSLTAGTLVTFLFYTRRFMWPMRQAGRILNDYERAQASAERIMGLRSEPTTIPERNDAIALGDIDGHIDYEQVSFRYEDTFADEVPEGDKPDWVLNGVNFSITAGEYVGVVGPTGAGKTTLIKLLMRMYDVDTGTIRIDGTDIQEVTLDSLRSQISYVSQEPYLFYGTVRENIAYGDPDIPDERVEVAARRAGAHAFITDLPDGYETMVGERGVKLSGGQRQRISIARAILREPAILILDEATSHVDNETEMLIQNSLDELIADRTTIAIAHRLSTIRDADTILVMDDGQLVEQGSHEELLAQDGLYANLWSVQVGEVDQLPEEFIERTANRRAYVEETDD